ncbi:MAG TPA: DUF4440 domain-containing protein [Gemmatimonadaceae bacterium]|nr:DUF4440 domain-containing protein [Gemmatimonadaceae bacterium]
MPNAGAISRLAVGCLLLLGCNRSNSATGDSSTASTRFDESAARAQILSEDSARTQRILAKHVDSAMVYYDPKVVHLATGKVINGVSGVRDLFTEGIKSNPRDFSFPSQTLEFSNDHSVAWEYGTYVQTSDAPNGKPVKSNGTFLNVWKNVGGSWKLVAETSSSP